MDDDLLLYVGMFSMSLMWLGLIHTVRRWPGNSSMSFSLHAAQTRGSKVFYFLLFLATLPMFFAFLAYWLVPNLQLGERFTIIALIGCVGQMIAAVVPQVPGLRWKVHLIAAYTMAITFLPLTAMIIFAEGLPSVVRIVASVMLAYMIATLALFLCVKQLQKKYLYFQAGYIAAFHMAIVAATVLVL